MTVISMRLSVTFTKIDISLKRRNQTLEYYLLLEMVMIIIKCAMLIMKSGQQQMMEGIELLNQKIRKGNLQILGNIGSK